MAPKGLSDVHLTRRLLLRWDGSSREATFVLGALPSDEPKGPVAADGANIRLSSYLEALNPVLALPTELAWI